MAWHAESGDPLYNREVTHNPHIGTVITDLPVLAWTLAVIGALVLGLAKAGLKGTGVIIVLLVALGFGSRASTGILMPLLMIGDIFAVIYYNRHAQWSYLRKLMPWVIAGVLIAVWIGKDLDESKFKLWMAVLILVSAALMIWGEYSKRLTVPKGGFFGAVMGLQHGCFSSSIFSSFLFTSSCGKQSTPIHFLLTSACCLQSWQASGVVSG
jgi:uncharacterized membrane protein YfcA